MKAVMSDRVKKWLHNKITRDELRAALDKLHSSQEDSVVVEIDGKQYTIKYCRR